MRLLLAVSLFFLASADIPDIWTMLPPMKTRRSDTVAVQSSGFIYMGGGCIENQSVTGGCTAITNLFERYDINKKEWSDLTPLPRPRYRHSSATVNGKIYFIHGRDLADNTIPIVDIYDIASGGWSQLTYQGDGLLNVSDSAAFVLGTTIYVVGGWSPDYSLALNSTITLNTADANPTFKSGMVPNKTISHGDLGANSINGKGYVFGGFNNDGIDPLNTFEEYDPSTNSWQQLNKFIHKRGDMGSAVVGQYLFVIGGEDKNHSTNPIISYPVADVEQWDSKTGTWSERTPISESRFRFTSANYGSWIFNLGGQENVVYNATGGDGYFPIDNHVAGLNIGSSGASSLTTSASSLSYSLLVALLLAFLM